ncbi:hypothetical protein MA16_Dca021575 [Dendrobium catenatum]|uniref:Uncharacterized protein n=1 Tax=Dendrobium catenatum TaxID=906689 RepID=A0A2I0VKK9_9ASPA|nr:hypothetical protein MA16_Dca021575 [Dendrobium catenatum]
MVVCSNSFVDVPVNLIEPQALVYHVRDNAGLDVRTHLDWLQCSSEFESDSNASSNHYGGSDPDHDSKLVRDRPIVSIASHGSFRGRDRRGR